MNSTLALCIWPPGWQSKACTFKPVTVDAVPYAFGNYVTCKVDRKCLREYENKYRSTGRKEAYVGEAGGMRGQSRDKGQGDRECIRDAQKRRTLLESASNLLLIT